MSKIQKALQNIQANDNRKDRRGSSRGNDNASSAGDSLDADHTIISPVLNRRKIAVDWEALYAGGLTPKGSDSNEMLRQLRDIKRPLIGNAFGKRATRVEDGNLIMVTSALSGEGKTFVSFNLACSMAQERDHTVVLVDADVAKRHTSELFGIQNEIGLLDILEHPDVPVESAIIDTDIPGLSILGAGKPRHNATELLASARMGRLTRQLASADKNRIIIFDTPPLLQTSESKVLASFVGQVAMVVGAEQTPKGAVLEAIELLGDDKVVNLVLNMAITQSVGTRGGYGMAYHSYEATTTKDVSGPAVTIEDGEDK